jgi:hypothetical protein
MEASERLIYWKNRQHNCVLLSWQNNHNNHNNHHYRIQPQPQSKHLQIKPTNLKVEVAEVEMVEEAVEIAYH